MSEKGKGILILAGMKPKGAPAKDADGDYDDDAGPPSSEGGDEYSPDPKTVDAGQEAIDAFHAKDATGFAAAMCKLIDAHEASKKGG